MYSEDDACLSIIVVHRLGLCLVILNRMDDVGSKGNSWPHRRMWRPSPIWNPWYLTWYSTVSSIRLGFFLSSDRQVELISGWRLIIACRGLIDLLILIVLGLIFFCIILALQISGIFLIFFFILLGLRISGRHIIVEECVLIWVCKHLRFKPLVVFNCIADNLGLIINCISRDIGFMGRATFAAFPGSRALLFNAVWFVIGDFILILHLQDLLI